MTTPLPEPKGQRLAYRCVAGDGEDEYEDFYTEAQLRAYGAAEFQRGVDAAAQVCETQVEKNLLPGGPHKFYKTWDECADAIRKLGETP